MFICGIETLPLNDGTQGNRFNFLNQKGFYRVRKNKSRGWFKTQRGSTFMQLHLGKLTIGLERKNSSPKLRHFAQRRRG